MAEVPDAAEQVAALLERLRALADPHNLAGMARYGINTTATLGVSMVTLRHLARELRPLRRSRPDLAHQVAAGLWSSWSP